MVHYAEAGGCRRAHLLRYFGEEYPQPDCGACDNCLSPRDTYDGTLDAQKLLSCVYRVRERSGFDFGLNHIVEVLTGADTEGVRQWGHQTVSTYGIGAEHTRPEWKAIGRELIRLGYLRQVAEKFNVVQLTDEGRAVLRQRQPVRLTRPVQAPASAAHAVGEIACDETLFERLRQLRKRLADERGVPPYIVFSDVALRLMAREYPRTEAQFLRISGVGTKKLREFGSVFRAEIVNHLREHPRQMFADDSFAPAAPGLAGLNDTARDSLRRFRAGRSVEDIAQERGLAASTIYGHLAAALEAGEPLDLSRLLSAEDRRVIDAALDRLGSGSLSLVREALGNRFDYGLLRLCRAARGRH
jgi:ATP-dependent DNA helicase RecQ